MPQVKGTMRLIVLGGPDPTCQPVGRAESTKKNARGCSVPNGFAKERTSNAAYSVVIRSR